MMKKFFLICFTAVVAVFLAPGAHCKVDWNVETTFKTGAGHLDVAIALNGKSVYVLTDQGEILIFDAWGTLKDTLTVGKGVDAIRTTPREDVLLIGNSKEGTVQVITLDFIHNIDVTGSPLKGKPDAPVTIAVFSDFQCSACAALVPMLDKVLEANPETVKVVFKNYPLRNHPHARQAAAAALAAQKQGKFWEFHDQLFKHHQKLGPQEITGIAKELGLDEQKLTTEMKDTAVMASISKDMSEAARLGVRGTPTVFINGRILRNRTLEGFQAAIDKALKKD
jgi:predicted DsbA family dithiol-disulfide isomerase